MTLRLFIATIFLVSSCTPSFAGRRDIPMISDTPYEETDEDYTRDPSRKDLFTLTMDVGDAISDEWIRENNVSGIDHFIQKLEAVLQQGNDKPRDTFIHEAVGFRNMYKDAYMDLKEAVALLLEAKEMLKEVDEVLEEVMDQLEEGVQAANDVASEMKDTTEQMKEGMAPSESPDSPGQPVDSSPVQNIEDQEPYLEPLPEVVDKAAKKVGDAKNWITQAKGRHEGTQKDQNTARDYDASSAAYLGKGATRGASRDVGTALNSERMVRVARKRLERTIKKAEKLQKFMDKFTGDKSPHKKAITKAQAINGKLQAAKEQMPPIGEQINEADQMMEQDLKEQFDEAKENYDNAPDEQKPQYLEQMEKIVAQAGEKKTQAADGAKSGEEAAKAAGCPACEAKKKAEEAKKGMEKIEKEAGRGDPYDLQDLQDIWVDVPEVKKAPSLGSGPGRNIKSRGLRYPDALRKKTGRIMQEFGGSSTMDYSR